MSNFVDVFGTVLSSSNMELGEHLLLSGWIDRYLLECPNKIVGALTRTLINIFDKCVFLATNSPNTGSLFFGLDNIIYFISICFFNLVI